ncbi:MAG TPA: GNAT family N-acetyltransferase [Flavisolibacter sp.]|nr:GNAT family N-acetyltransferase [Flavisolibacter sp.]
MLIRHATGADITAMISLVGQLGYDISREQASSNLHIYEKVQGFILVAVKDEKVIGFISGIFIPLFHTHELMFRITALCVDENERGRGVGKRLIEKIEEICKKKECNYLEVTSGRHRKENAHIFYESVGYTAYRGKRFIKRLSENNSN